MSKTLPSSFRLLSLTFRHLFTHKKTYGIAVLLATALQSALFIFYGRYAIGVMSFSEGGQPVPEDFFMMTVVAFGLAAFVMLAYMGFGFLFSIDPKITTGKMLRSLPRAMIIAFLWWIFTLFIPGFIAGFFTASIPQEQMSYIPSVLTIVLTIIALSFTLFVPHFAFGKQHGFFRSLLKSVHTAWPVLHLLLLRIVVAWMFSAVVIFLAVIIGAGLAFFLPPVIAAVVTVVWVVLLFNKLTLYWIAFVSVLSGQAATAR